MSICVSCFSKRDIASVAVVRNGVLVMKNVSRIQDEDVSHSTFESMIYTFSVALQQLKYYVDEHSDEDVSAVFECNNSTFINWVTQGVSRDRYQSSFIDMMELLDSIPVSYSFTYTSKPIAMQFAKEKYLPKSVIGGLDTSFFEEPEG